MTMSEKKIKKLYVDARLDPPKVQKFKSGLRVQFINQDLKQAIKQMKNNIKAQYKSNGHLSDRNQMNANPQNNNEKSNGNHLFFTQNYKKKMEARLYEIQQRRKQLNAKSLQKQMKARLIKKIEENVQLRQKMDLLRDVQERRQLLLIQKSQREKRKHQEEQMLHSSSVINAEMYRKSKKKTYKKQLKDSRIQQQQSLKDLKFKNYLTQKQKQERKMLLNSRLQFLSKNKSQSAFELRDSLTSNRSHRKSGMISSRLIKTSHLSSKKQRNNEQDEQELIIKKYSMKKKDNEEGTEGTSQEIKRQKKYNKIVRDQKNDQKNDQHNEQKYDQHNEQKLNTEEVGKMKQI